MGVNASGRIRNMNIALSILYIGSVVVTYFILLFTHSYVISFAVGILSAPASTLIYVVVLKRLVPEFTVGAFFRKTYFPMAMVAVVSLGLAWLIAQADMPPLLSFIAALVVCSSFVCLSVFFWVLDAHAREIFLNFVKSKLPMKRS